MCRSVPIISSVNLDMAYYYMGWAARLLLFRGVRASGAGRAGSGSVVTTSIKACAQALCLAVALPSALISCGGGGGDGPTAPITPDPALSACSFYFPSFFPPATRTESLSTSDCYDETIAQHRDQYRMAMSATGAVRLSLASSAFDTRLVLRDPDRGTIAENDDESLSSRNSSFKILLNQTGYVIHATSSLSGALGPYTLTATPVSMDVTNCEKTFIRDGITTSQTLSATDCATGSYDEYTIFIRTGRDVRIQMKSTAFNPVLELWDMSGARVAFNDNRNSTTTDADLIYNVGGKLDYYVIRARSSPSRGTGAYTLQIDAF